MDECVAGLVADALPFDGEDDALKPEAHVAIRTQVPACHAC